MEGDRFVVTTTERGKTRTDFSTDDVGVLNHYLLVQFGESWRLRRGLPIVVTRLYPPVPAGFEVRADPRGDVEMSWTADDGRTVTAGNLRFESERRLANVCRVPLPVLEATLLDDSGRPQPLF
ncbi:hypothetical protein [Kineococcus sp. SYSU DK002]|uniref:hypothetical protein n=1 Tax=Kineococcus sp. SYSU DK002 TaxID=3383123 RepID=UPI003D7DF4FB